MSVLDLPDNATVTLTVRQLREMLGSKPYGATDGDERSTLPMTVGQVADAVGKSASTVRSWLSSGRLEGFKLEGEWRVRPEAIEGFFARAEEGHGQPEGERETDSVDLGSWRTGRAS